MKNELFTIGPFAVYGYGFMIALGVLTGWFTAEYRARKYKADTDHVFFLMIWCLLGGFLGAKILFWITEWREIVSEPGIIFGTMADGFVVYGGILGGIAAGGLYCRIKKICFLEYFDLVIPSVALAQGFGRIGCLLAGCCYGKETGGWPSITFHESDFAPNGAALIPTQIYSSILDFIHFAVLICIARRKKADGEVAAWYMVFYSTGRFILEFFRGDLIRGSVGTLSTSQFISLFVFAAGLILLFLSKKQMFRCRKVLLDNNRNL